MSNRFNAEDYIDVQQRIVRFWSEYPDGAILTELMSPPDDFNTCRYKAIVFKHREDKTPSATGYAFEIAGGSGANRTSHEENCETSAIGRALANMGYATSGKDRASKQEMRKVQDGPQTRSQARSGDEAPPAVSDADTSPRINQDGLTTLHAAANKRNLNHADVHHLVVARYNLGSTKDLTGKKLAELMTDLRSLTDEQLADLVLTGMERAKAKQSDLGIPTTNAASYRS